MNECEKNCSVAGTTERAVGVDFAGHVPDSNSNTDTGNLLVSDLLHVGSENGLTLRELVQITGEDERTIRRRIQAERKGGTLILSDCRNGYFLPDGAFEVQRFIRSMSRRSREIAAVSRAAEDALAAMLGQEVVDGW